MMCTLALGPCKVSWEVKAGSTLPSQGFCTDESIRPTEPPPLQKVETVQSQPGVPPRSISRVARASIDRSALFIWRRIAHSTCLGRFLFDRPALDNGKRPPVSRRSVMLQILPFSSDVSSLPTTWRPFPGAHETAIQSTYVSMDCGQAIACSTLRQ